MVTLTTHHEKLNVLNLNRQMARRTPGLSESQLLCGETPWPKPLGERRVYLS